MVTVMVMVLMVVVISSDGDGTVMVTVTVMLVMPRIDDSGWQYSTCTTPTQPTPPHTRTLSLVIDNVGPALLRTLHCCTPFYRSTGGGKLSLCL